MQKRFTPGNGLSVFAFYKVSLQPKKNLDEKRKKEIQEHKKEFHK